MTLQRQIRFLLVIFFMAVLQDCKDSDDVAAMEEADLSLNLTVNNNDPYHGEEVVFTLRVSNSGPSMATGVVVKDLLSSGFKYVGATDNAYNESTGLWSIPALAAGSTAALTITAAVNPDGDYNNIAEVTSSDVADPDSTPDNNVQSEDDQQHIMLEPRVPSGIQVSTVVSNVTAGDGLTISDEGILYACNYGRSLVYQITEEGNASVFLRNQPGAAGVAIGPDGYLYLARYNSSDIVRVSLDDGMVESFANNVAAPIALDFDSEGNLYTNNNVNNSITKIDPSGTRTIIPIRVYNNSSLTLDDEDNIYVSDYASGVIKKLNAVTYAEETFTNLPIQNGVGFVVYAAGYLYATAIQDHTIFKIDKDGKAELIAGTPGKTGVQDGIGERATFDTPNGIVASSDGLTLFVAQQGTRSAVRKINGIIE